MRKENREQKSANLARVQAYHCHTGGEGYVTLGFPEGLLYLRSDRKEKIVNGIREKCGLEPDGYGLEVETESCIPSTTALAELLEKVVFQRFKFPEMWKMQGDGSLGGASSAECITGIMAKSRIRNDYQAWRLMFDHYFPAFGITADSYATDCGMHVNVSNACFGKTVAQREEAIRKLYYIINKHYNICRKLFYRAPDKTRWCGQMDYSEARTMDLRRMSSSHMNCFNGSHYDAGRIEIRLVGGQKDFDTFLKTMESVFFLVERVKSISWSDCDNLVAIFTGCNQAVFARLCNMRLSSAVINEIRPTVKHDAELDCVMDTAEVPLF